MNSSVPVAARSKALVCGRSFDGILGSNKFNFVTKFNFAINFSVVSTPVSNGVILQTIRLRKGTLHANNPMQFCVWLFLHLLGVCWIVRTHNFAKTGHGPHSSKLVICAVMLLFVLSYVLFVWKCVPYYSHRVSTRLQLTYIINIARGMDVCLLYAWCVR
jgi:hypothetical protein